MAARKPTAKPRSKVAAPRVHQSEADCRAVMGGVLEHMAEVLGPGAIYSLVHYSAVEEGLHLPSGSAGTAGAVHLVADLLGTAIDVKDDQDRRVRVRVHPSATFNPESRASAALAVGLLEGALTTAHRHKMQIHHEAALAADGTLTLDLEG